MLLAQQKRKEQRQEEILLSLDNLTYATREQLQIVNNLKGDRNAHRILHRMEKDRLISSIRTERKIYFLSNNGKNIIGSNQGELKKSQIKHTLMRNEMYIKLGMPVNWQKEVPVRFNEESRYLIPDAMYNQGNVFTFIEIDNKQAMTTNFEKIKKYSELFKAMYHQYGTHPTLIWYTLSNIRKEKISSACESSKIKYEVY